MDSGALLIKPFRARVRQKAAVENEKVSLILVSVMSAVTNDDANFILVLEKKVLLLTSGETEVM